MLREQGGGSRGQINGVLRAQTMCSPENREKTAPPPTGLVFWVTGLRVYIDTNLCPIFDV